jgi:hypothetical protein
MTIMNFFLEFMAGKFVDSFVSMSPVLKSAEGALKEHFLSRMLREDDHEDLVDDIRRLNGLLDDCVDGDRIRATHGTLTSSLDDKMLRFEWSGLNPQGIPTGCLVTLNRETGKMGVRYEDSFDLSS